MKNILTSPEPYTQLAHHHYSWKIYDRDIVSRCYNINIIRVYILEFKNHKRLLRAVTLILIRRPIHSSLGDEWQSFSEIFDMSTEKGTQFVSYSSSSLITVRASSCYSSSQLLLMSCCSYQSMMNRVYAIITVCITTTTIACTRGAGITVCYTGAVRVQEIYWMGNLKVPGWRGSG